MKLRKRVIKKRRADTRKVYGWESRFPQTRSSIGELRALINRIWLDRGCKVKPPKVVAGQGVRYGGAWCSYTLGRSLIVLARHQRNRLIAIHETVHALGPSTHGTRFQNLYAELIAEYLWHTKN